MLLLASRTCKHQLCCVTGQALHASLFPPAPLPSCCRYYESKGTFARLRVPMFPPGRIMLLRRLKPTRHSSSSGSGGGGGSGGQALPQQVLGRWRDGDASMAAGGVQQVQDWQRQRGRHWDAVWVQAEAFMSEGILLSRWG